MDIKIWVALIAAGTSVFGAVAAFLSAIYVNHMTRKREQELENKKGELQTALETRKTSLQKELEDFKAILDARKSERDALLDYRYEARKRLYTECEPVIFQLTEFATEALYRIRSLARTARQGKLDETGEHWLRHDGYYMLSTAYKLFAPVAVFKLLQTRLTLVDLGLDERINVQYELGRGLAYTWTDDFTLAGEHPGLGYEPKSDAQEAQVNPPVHWRQGMFLGAVDNAAESLITQSPSGLDRVESFGVFSNSVADQGSSAHRSLAPFIGMLHLFHPRTRPVLWRILVVQAHILYALSNVASEGGTSHPPRLQSLPQTLRDELDWRREGQHGNGPIDEPFAIAESYLAKRFSGLWTHNRSAKGEIGWGSFGPGMNRNF